MTGTEYPAAEIVRNANHGGKTNWFLPSKDELNMMYVNLHQQGLGGFHTEIKCYLSSSAFSDLGGGIWEHYFGGSGNQYNTATSDIYGLVRAIRSF